MKSVIFIESDDKESISFITDVIDGMLSEIKDNMRIKAYQIIRDAEEWNGYHRMIVAPAGLFDQIYKDCEEDPDEHMG